MPRRWVTCPQCDERIELDRESHAVEASARTTEPDVIARRCQLCEAWIRIEGWSEWTATHYSMTPFGDAADALRGFPQGVWLQAADAAPQN